MRITVLSSSSSSASSFEHIATASSSSASTLPARDPAQMQLVETGPSSQAGFLSTINALLGATSSTPSTIVFEDGVIKLINYEGTVLAESITITLYSGHQIKGFRLTPVGQAALNANLTKAKEASIVALKFGYKVSVCVAKVGLLTARIALLAARFTLAQATEAAELAANAATQTLNNLDRRLIAASAVVQLLPAI